MLVLRRNEGQEVVVYRPDGTEIGRVMVTEAERGKARLGFRFPPEIKVDRLEVYREKYPETTERDYAEGEPKTR